MAALTLTGIDDSVLCDHEMEWVLMMDEWATAAGTTSSARAACVRGYAA